MSEMLYREIPLDRALAKREHDGEHLRLTFPASSETPVDRFGVDEILDHSPESVRLERLTSIGTALVNHDRDLRAGKITGARIENARLIVDVEFGTSAMAQEFQKEVEDGTLRGVSIGYRVHVWQFDNDEDTMTAVDWEPMEVSFVSVPADATVGVGRSDSTSREGWESIVRSAAETGGRAPTSGRDEAVNKEQLQAMFPNHRDLVARLHDDGKTPEEIAAAVRAEEEKGRARTVPTDPEPKPPGGDEAKRAEEIARSREIAQLAESHGLRVSDYMDCKSVGEASQKMLRSLAEAKKSEPEVTPRGEPDPAVAEVTYDAADKFRDAGVAAVVRSAGLDLRSDEGKEVMEKGDIRLGEAKDATDFPLNNFIAHCAEQEGYKGARNWNKLQLISWARQRGGYDPAHALRSGSGLYERSPAQKTTGQFSGILANAADLMILRGFGLNIGTTYETWTAQGERADFKQATIAALAHGRLSKVEENEAFPELTQADGSYNQTLEMHGSTVSLSFQALANDELGEFMRSLQRAGSIARRSIDREVYRVLLNATWTNDVTGSATLATASNLSTVRAALAEKQDPAGEVMGLTPRYLLVDHANVTDAETATGEINAPGQTTQIPSLNRAITTVPTHWIGDTNLLSGALTTDYYLTSDPALVDTVLVSMLRGVSAPMVVPFDPMAVAAEKWKIMLPFVATAATHDDADGNTRITGIQKATVAA